MIGSVVGVLEKESGGKRLRVVAVLDVVVVSEGDR